MRIFLSLMVAMLGLNSANAQTAEQKGYAIMQRQAQVDEGWQSELSQGQMVLYTSGGTVQRSFSAERLEQGAGNLSKFTFHGPADVKGTVLLSHSKTEPTPDMQWLFLPSIQRVKRIASGNRKGSFMGSEFSFEDLTGYELNDSKYKWVADQACPGAAQSKCYVVEAYPLNRDSAYSKRVIWVDQQYFRPFQIDYYNRGGQFMKRLNYAGYAVFLQRFWRPGRLTMQNAQTGKRTDMVWSGYRLQSGIAASQFEPQRLGR
ncbi:MAG: outer membrane lipoprotein-sorting protein [Gammaproteobacteria bacterium]|nr:outer membrane lipoprotein-sorting protein [Gammaproteobacteria bacterium]